MQYLLTTEELQKMQQDSELKGYKVAENLLIEVLTNSEQDPEFYVKQPLTVNRANQEAPTTIWDDVNKDNGFRKLLERLKK